MGFQIVTWEITDFMGSERLARIFHLRRKGKEKNDCQTHQRPITSLVSLLICAAWLI